MSKSIYQFKSYPQHAFGRHTAARILNEDGSLGVQALLLRSSGNRERSVSGNLAGLSSAKAAGIKFALLVFNPEFHALMPLEVVETLCKNTRRQGNDGDEYGLVFIDQVQGDDDFWDKGQPVAAQGSRLIKEFELVNGRIPEQAKSDNPQLTTMVSVMAKELGADSIIIDLNKNKVAFMHREGG